MDGEVIKPRPTRRTPRLSGCRCLLLLLGLAALGIGAVVSYYAVSVGRSLVPEMRMPQSSMRTDAPDAVRPLITPATRFDVAVVVWVRKPNALTSHPERYEAEYVPTDPAAKYIQSQFGLPAGEVHVPEYEAVFSDIVMRDVTLRDKSTTANVSFDLPLARFYDKRLYAEDVRAVVVLLPPLAGLDVQSLEDPSIRAPALDDSLARRIDNVPAAEALYTAVTLIHNQLPEEIGRLPAGKNGSLVTGTAQTPYLSTQAHVLLVNDTPSLNSEYWEEVWTDTYATACGKAVFGGAGNRYMCERGTFLVHGFWRSRCTRDGSDDVMYGPYLRPVSAGALHYVKLPVQRSDGPPPDTLPGPTSMPVNLSVRLSTVSPLREGSFLQRLPPLNLSAPYHTLRTDHDTVEMILSGLGDLPVDGLHPWRRMFLASVSTTANVAVFLLTIVYFWTRQTSAGLSTLAPWLDLLSVGAFLIFDWPQKWPVLPFAGIMALPPLFALRVTAPWTLEGSGWQPWGWRLRHRVWSHAERASRRRELPLGQALLLVGACALAMFALEHFDLHLVHSLAPAPDLTWKKHALLHLGKGIGLATRFLQLYLNHQARTFAGDFALAIALLCVGYIADLAYLTSFVGRYEPDTMRVYDALHIAGGMLMLWQAATLPKVPQDVADDDEE